MKSLDTTALNVSSNGSRKLNRALRDRKRSTNSGAKFWIPKNVRYPRPRPVLGRVECGTCFMDFVVKVPGKRSESTTCAVCKRHHYSGQTITKGQVIATIGIDPQFLHEWRNWNSPAAQAEAQNVRLRKIIGMYQVLAKKWAR